MAVTLVVGDLVRAAGMPMSPVGIIIEAFDPDLDGLRVFWCTGWFWWHGAEELEPICERP